MEKRCPVNIWYQISQWIGFENLSSGKGRFRRYFIQVYLELIGTGLLQRYKTFVGFFIGVGLTGFFVLVFYALDVAVAGIFVHQATANRYAARGVQHVDSSPRIVRRNFYRRMDA